MAQVSVLLNVYNDEMFLEECIKSVLSQSFKDLEQCRRTNAPSGPHSRRHLLRAMPDDDFGALRWGQAGIWGNQWRFGGGLMGVKAADSLRRLAVAKITQRDA